VAPPTIRSHIDIKIKFFIKTPTHQFLSKYFHYFRNYLEKIEIKMKLHPVSPKLSILGHTFIRTFLLICICRICCRSFRNTVLTTLYITYCMLVKYYIMDSNHLLYITKHLLNVFSAKHRGNMIANYQSLVFILPL